jgi:hypothetical protein
VLASRAASSRRQRAIVGASRAGRQDCGVFGGTALAYEPGGALLARGLCDGQLQLLEARTGRVTRRVRLGNTLPALAPGDGSLAVAVDRSVRLVDPRSGAVRSTLAAPGPVTFVASAPTGGALAAVSVDDSSNSWVTLWRRGRPRRIATAPFDRA